MFPESDSKSPRFDVGVRSADLDAPTLVDRIGAELLNHLCACPTCSAVFAAQKDSVGEAGCVIGRRIVSQSKVTWQQRRAALALGHLTADALDDYLFDRLTFEEMDALEHHARVCPLCINELIERETLIACIKDAFRERRESAATPAGPAGVISVRFRARAFISSVTGRLGPR